LDRGKDILVGNYDSKNLRILKIFSKIFRSISTQMRYTK
jgi:hypothetical protein